MKNKLKIIIILYCLVTSCNSMKSNISNKKCTYKQKFENLLQTIVDTPELQQYFKFQDVAKDNDLVVLINDKLVKSATIKKNGVNILFLSQSEISEKNINRFLDFQKIEIKEQIAIIKMVYKIEGIEYNAKFKLDNCEWKLLEKQLFEN